MSVCVTQCSLILVPRCAGVLLAPRHSPGDLRLLQHPGVSELIPAFQSEENIGVGKAARGEQMKLMALQKKKRVEKQTNSSKSSLSTERCS